ncbi:hypothetical protein EKK58_01540 [Candidatus Dependentiae bacterium]|nr:MAG: hypothetical protein EKK58_01540 [Candidatus Dependentiae bacterium]
MKMIYNKKTYTVFLWLSWVLCTKSAVQYTFINQADAKIKIYFGEQQGTDYYKLEYAVPAKSMGMFSVSDGTVIEVVKIVLDKGSSIGRAVRFLYPEKNCQNIGIASQIYNNTFNVGMSCNK